MNDPQTTSDINYNQVKIYHDEHIATRFISSAVCCSTGFTFEVMMMNTGYADYPWWCRFIPLLLQINHESTLLEERLDDL